MSKEHNFQTIAGRVLRFASARGRVTGMGVAFSANGMVLRHG
jgi:hypothetical protein